MPSYALPARRYKGRTQLLPFLKSAGFTMEESMHWWREAMTKDPSIDASKFDKEYTYGVKYTSANDRDASYGVVEGPVE